MRNSLFGRGEFRGYLLIIIIETFALRLLFCNTIERIDRKPIGFSYFFNFPRMKLILVVESFRKQEMNA